MKALMKLLTLFLSGGLIYILIEMLWRGHTHWTMFMVGGICFVLVGLINEGFTFEMPLVFQMVISMFVITTVEFITGYIIKIRLSWNVWDYSEMPFNLKGQICLPYMGLWFLLSALAIVLDDYLRYWLFREEKPRYKIL